jgi:hypothetical protein
LGVGRSWLRLDAGIFFFVILHCFFYTSGMAAGGYGVNAVDAMQNVLIL